MAGDGHHLAAFPHSHTNYTSTISSHIASARDVALQRLSRDPTNKSSPAAPRAEEVGDITHSLSTRGTLASHQRLVRACSLFLDICVMVGLVPRCVVGMLGHSPPHSLPRFIISGTCGNCIPRDLLNLLYFL